jgi:hypothetical protein
MAIIQEHDLSPTRRQRLRSPKAAGNGLPERTIEQLPGSQLIKRGVGDYLTRERSDQDDAVMAGWSDDPVGARVDDVERFACADDVDPRRHHSKIGEARRGGVDHLDAATPARIVLAPYVLHALEARRHLR